MYFGWDISTSIIGLAAFGEDGLFVSSEYLDLRKIDSNLLDKAEAFSEWMGKDLVYRIDHPDNESVHFIEDRLSNFARGRTSMQTILKLASFNGIVSWIIRDCLAQDSSQIVHIHPSTVKAEMKKQGLVIPKGSDKKELTLDYVRNVEPRFRYEETRNGNPQPYCYDMADAYVTCRAGIARCKRTGKLRS